MSNTNNNVLNGITCNQSSPTISITQNLQQDTNTLQYTSSSNINANVNTYSTTNYCVNQSGYSGYTANVNDCDGGNSNRCIKPPLHDVYINDRAFEIQSLGGLPHYSVLQAGIAGAAKMAQTHECFIFVLCTPADLCEQPNSLSSYTSNHYKKYMDRLLVDDMTKASLNLQMDGEALPRIT